MIALSTHTLWLILFALLVISSFFSGSETSMMSLNKYKLQNKALKQHAASIKLQNLIKRPDRLLGIILIGNTFANIVASSIMTIIAYRIFGDLGIIISTIFLTIVILIFAEIMPKTLAALYPEKVAYAAVDFLHLLLKGLYPLVWLTSSVSNKVLALFNIKVQEQSPITMEREELRNLIKSDNKNLSATDKHMLTGVLDLENMCVEDIMIPRGQLEMIDTNKDWSDIIKDLKSLKNNQVIVTKGGLNNVLGILYIKSLNSYLLEDSLNKHKLIGLLKPIIYIPAGVSVSRQLDIFKKNQTNNGVIIDEYSDILGSISLEDIIEEIIGEIFSNKYNTNKQVQELNANITKVAGSANIRELNRQYNWSLPTDGPNTLSGLIIEELGTIPDSGVCIKIGEIIVEVVQWKGRKIDWVTITKIKSKTDN